MKDLQAFAAPDREVLNATVTEVVTTPTSEKSEEQKNNSK